MKEETKVLLFVLSMFFAAFLTAVVIVCAVKYAQVYTYELSLQAYKEYNLRNCKPDHTNL